MSIGAGVNVDEVFTTDAAETPVHVAGWGFLGDTWPFFRPNFVNMDAHREARRAEEVPRCDRWCIEHAFCGRWY